MLTVGYIGHTDTYLSIGKQFAHYMREFLPIQFCTGSLLKTTTILYLQFGAKRSDKEMEKSSINVQITKPTSYWFRKFSSTFVTEILQIRVCKIATCFAVQLRIRFAGAKNEPHSPRKKKFVSLEKVYLIAQEMYILCPKTYLKHINYSTVLILVLLC